MVGCDVVLLSSFFSLFFSFLFFSVMILVLVLDLDLFVSGWN